METFLNNASSSLLNSIGPTETSFTVHDGSAFSEGDGSNFRVLIDDEYVLITGRSGDVLTCTRGVEGSTANAHSANASVIAIVTAGGLNQCFEEHGGFSGDYEDLTNLPTLGSVAALDSAVTGTELDYVHGVTSGIQSQIDQKANSSWIGAGSGIAPLDNAGKVPVANLPTVTANKALVSNGSGQTAASSVTATELGYVSGVTSAIQTQLNAKAATASLGTAATKNTGNGPGLIPLPDENGQTAIGGVWSLAGNGDINTSGTMRLASAGGKIVARNKIEIGTTGELSTSAVLLKLQGVSGQSGDYFVIVNSSDVQLVNIDSAGRILANGFGITGLGQMIEGNGTIALRYSGANIQLTSTSEIKFADGGDAYTGLTFDTGIVRDSAGVIRLSNGSTGVSGLTCGKIVAQSTGYTVPTCVLNAAYGADASGIILQVNGTGGGVAFQVTNDQVILSPWLNTQLGNRDTAIAAVVSSVTTVAASAAAAQSTADSASTTASSAASAASSAATAAAAAQSTADSATSAAAAASALASSALAAIPTNNASLTNGAGYITAASIPTAVSSFTNDAGYATSSGWVADGTYTVGLGLSQNGTITISGGKITAIQQAS